MKKGKRNKANKAKKNTNKNLVFYGFGVVFVLIVVALIIGITDFPAKTGASIYIKSYGVPNKLMNNKASTFQTLIELKQPSLMKLGERGSSVAQEIANKIVKSEDFAKGIKDIYKNDPASAPIPKGALAEVKKAAKIEEANFKDDLTCLNKIGKNYRHNQDFQMVMVSELKYVECSFKFDDKLYANLKYSFFKKDDNSFLCSQESDKLFLITKDSGTVNVNITDC